MFIPTLKFIQWKVPAQVEAPIDFVAENIFVIASHLERGFYFEFSGCNDGELAVLAGASDGAEYSQLKTLTWYADHTGFPVWLGFSGFLCHQYMRVGDVSPVDISQLEGIGRRLPDDDNGPFLLIPFEQGFITFADELTTPH